MVKAYNPFLKHAQETRLMLWLQSVNAQGDVTLLEQRLRESLTRSVIEVAHWSPKAWRPSIVWCLHLWDLPAWRHQSEGKKLPTTLVLPEQPTLEKYHGQQPPLLEIWLHHWTKLWPKKGGDSQKSLNHFVSILQNHSQHFSQLEDKASAIALRKNFQQRMERIFRIYSRQPTVIFVYLTLLALDYERLRGGLVVRALYHPGES